MSQPILIVAGTRPEAIKLVPVYNAFKRVGVPVIFCATSQHDYLLKSVLDLFGMKPDYDLAIMKPGQDLVYLTQAILTGMQKILMEVQPALVLVQGDTTTAMASTLASFYARTPVGHVEAGLRTNDLMSPFPEEMNRRFIGLIAAYHFAPTQSAVANVLLQGVHRNLVFCTGNTIVDALRIIQENIMNGSVKIDAQLQQLIDEIRTRGHKIILFTMHRRESYQTDALERVLKTLIKALELYPDLSIFFPYHPHPAIKQAIDRVALTQHHRMHVRPALAYHDFIYALSAADWVMTDSGGVQEESASLNKKTLVLRNQTERMESVWAGISCIVGTDEEKILHGIEKLYQETAHIQRSTTLYGDGFAAEKIAHIVQQKVYEEPQ